MVEEIHKPKREETVNSQQGSRSGCRTSTLDSGNIERSEHMYIHPFVAGVLTTIIVEVTLIIVAAVVKYNNDKKN